MSQLPKPDNRITVDVKDGMNDDIISVLQKRIGEAVKEAKPIAQLFKGYTRLETARNIWTWLRTKITYEKDPEGVQDIRMPRYFHYHKKGDCKSFTLNALAIWANIYPEDHIHFFYAGYSPGTKTPTHVYAKIKTATGSEIIIDGCWYFFNSEKKYTFGKQSPDMQVRTLSDDLINMPASPAGMRRPTELQRIYQSMTPDQRKRMDSCMGDLVQLQLIQEARKRGQMSDDKLVEALNGIAARHKPKGKKVGHKNKKAMHIFNATNPVMLLGRSCFLLAVSLNLNGLASKMGKLNEWGHFNHILDFWYIIGGSPKKFLKIINHSAKKKKLFLSKKAKRKYEARYGPLSPGEVAYEQSHSKGVHDEIGALPAIAAAAIGMIPVLAGVIPKMISAFKAAAPQHPEALREANGLASEGQDLVDTIDKHGYPLSEDDVNSVMGHELIGPDGKPLPQSKGGGFKVGGAHFVFNTKSFSPIGDPDFVTAPDDTPTVEPDDSPAPGPPGPASNNNMATLAPLLQNLATAGFGVASNVMSQSQNPNVRKWGGALGEADSILAGKNLQAAGYTDLAKYHSNNANIKSRIEINMFPIATGGVVLFVLYELYELFKSKPSVSNS